MARVLQLLSLVLLLFSACKKEPNIKIDDNDPPSPGTVSTIKIQHYVTKLYIDLLGRTPTEIERDREVAQLKEAALSVAARELLIRKLQRDTAFVAGDSSYFIAYTNRLYEICKARFIEGAEDDVFHQQIGNHKFAIHIARLEGDSVAVFRNLDEIARNQRVLDTKALLRAGLITFNEMVAAMLNNAAYDIINMNTFNFINATFDDLYGRFPTNEEYQIAFPVIEQNKSAVLFGIPIQNKTEYCRALTENAEFYEGMLRWTFATLLGREPSPAEAFHHFKAYSIHKDFRELQLVLLRTNEYAQF
jgi:hypothetical protein